MIKGSGLSVFPGVAIGKAVVYRRPEHQQAAASGDPIQEAARFAAAVQTAKEQLGALYEKAKKELGEEQAAIVEVQLLMLDDLDYLESVAAEISTGTDAATAAAGCGEAIAQVFAALDDEYMRERAADIRDVSSRVADILSGSTGFRLPEGSFLLVAEDLAPSETIQLPRERILGFLTPKGSSSSHTAILARTLNIPSLVQADVDLEAVEKAHTMAVDGFTGTWYIDPDPQTLAELQKKQSEAEAGRAALEAYRGRTSVPSLHR